MLCFVAQFKYRSAAEKRRKGNNETNLLAIF
jgi:hypothetical protein